MTITMTATAISLPPMYCVFITISIQSQGVPPAPGSYGETNANAVYGASAYISQSHGQGHAPSSSTHYHTGGEMAVDGIGDDGEQGGGGYDSPRGRQLGTQQRLR